MVVAEDRRVPPVPAAERAVVAQVGAGGEGGVVDVVRVGLAVAVAVEAPPLPGLGDELHGADGAVEDRISVESAAVGVTDRRDHIAEVVGRHAVEGDADDRPVRVAVHAQRSLTMTAVLALDRAHGGDRAPRDPTARGELGHLLLGAGGRR